ncbi:MAG: response regulator [Lachnospiraceae bacterium]|nr:response regulator [Lachnospiraceae bacterium]
MRIAVFDDNVADRRHAERLLKRESDRLHALGEEGHLIDCFGSTDKLVSAAESYDVFLIDHREGNEDSLGIVQRLRKLGIPQPMIICVPDETGSSQSKEKNLFRISKPYTRESLIPMVSECAHCVVKRGPRVELRNDIETIYTPVEDIVYVTSKELGFLTVGLKGREPFRMMGDTASFYRQVTGIKTDPALIPISPKSFINARYLKKAGTFTVEMTDQTRLRTSPAFWCNIREVRRLRSVSRKQDQ